MQFLSTFSFTEIPDMLLNSYDKTQEDEIWVTWLNKEEQLSFVDFKKKYFKQMKKNRKKSVTLEDEKKAIDFALKYITPTKESGELS